MLRRALLVVLIALAGCGGDDPAPPGGDERAASTVAAGDQPGSPTDTGGDEGAPVVAVPDGGMPAGHDNEPRRVTVPARDASAPSAVLRLASAEAVSGGAPPDPVRLERPVLEPLAVGRDKQGMARIRVSLEARLRCGDEEVPLIRYFPGPQIGPAWLPPGRVVPVERTRRVRFGLECPSGELQRADGTLWADATSARETEASSAPVRFTYRP